MRAKVIFFQIIYGMHLVLPYYCLLPSEIMESWYRYALLQFTKVVLEFPCVSVGKDLALSLLWLWLQPWHVFDPWPRNFYSLWA